VSGPDAGAVWEQAQDKLRSLESSHRLRADIICAISDSSASAHREVDGKELINFCSNDYLDLAHHPDVKQGAIEAVKQYGSGSMASRLVCGTLPIHWELEKAVAQLKRTESALVFSSGYLACLGVVQALSRRADDSLIPIIFDRLVHASLVDGATQERRSWRSFPHNDVESLELLLKQNAVREWPSALVITEGVFSMDGDMAPLAEMADLCAKYHAILVVDDAHGTGTVGDAGEGSAAVAGVADQPHVVQVGTMSKALGAQGGFVTGPQVLRDLMVNTARTFIFDTGLAPACCGAALAAIKIMKDEPERIARLHENVTLLRSLLSRTSCHPVLPTPIIPVMMPDEESAVSASRKLLDKGFLVTAIRPPTVPPGTSRLRITLSTSQKTEDVRRLGQTISMMDTA
jgi:8-amino-7-oxononanoate synthase